MNDLIYNVYTIIQYLRTTIWKGCYIRNFFIIINKGVLVYGLERMSRGVIAPQIWMFELNLGLRASSLFTSCVKYIINIFVNELYTIISLLSIESGHFGKCKDFWSKLDGGCYHTKICIPTRKRCLAELTGLHRVGFCHNSCG